MISSSKNIKNTHADWLHYFKIWISSMLEYSFLWRTIFKIHIAILLCQYGFGKKISPTSVQIESFFKDSNIQVTRKIYQSGKGGPISPEDKVDQEVSVSLQDHVTKISVKANRAQFLATIVALIKPAQVLEIGTGYGISAAHIARSLNETSKVLTLDINKAHTEIAERLHEFLGNTKKVKLVNRSAARYLTKEQMESPQLLFIDGGHTKEVNLELFTLLLQKTQSGAIFIFDDIHWSTQMFEFWSTVQQHPSIAWSKDLKFFGIAVRNGTYSHDLWLDDILRYGSPQTKNDLAVNYRDGRARIEVNYDLAFTLAQASYNEGWRFAPVTLASLYTGGLGVTRDVTQAISLLEKCIQDTESPWAYYDLGRIYENGCDIPRDLVKARTLYTEAATRGNENAKRRLEQLDEFTHSYG